MIYYRLFNTYDKAMDQHFVDEKSRVHKRENLELILYPVEFVDTVFPVYKAKNVGA